MNLRQTQKIQKVLTYYKDNKRTMPWRDISNPYKIFVSEMMLQQTQVERVKIKYAEFIKKFPTIKSVALAEKSELLKTWQGLGYNRRALFIKRACEEIILKHNGKFPKDFTILQTLPGIGPSTAGAICAFAYNQPVFFIETNVRAVILHFFFKNKEKVSDKEVMEVLKKVTPYNYTQSHEDDLIDVIPAKAGIQARHLQNKDLQRTVAPTPYINNISMHNSLILDPCSTCFDLSKQKYSCGVRRDDKREYRDDKRECRDDKWSVSPRDWYYALYDYGTYLKKTLGNKKKTQLHKKSKHYTKQSKFIGSFRQKRAQVLKIKLHDPDISDTEIMKKLNIEPQVLEDVLISLTKDGLI